MSKTLSKIVAVIISISMLCALPVFVGAADEYIDISKAEITAVSGTWKSDYVGTIRITLYCNVDSIGNSDVIFTIGKNDAASIIRKVKKSDADISVDSGVVTIDYEFNANMSHSDTYFFEIKEGAFKTDDGKVSASYTFEESGNLIIESIDKEEEPLNPIQRLIKSMQASKFAKLLTPIIMILRWFDSL